MQDTTFPVQNEPRFSCFLCLASPRRGFHLVYKVVHARKGVADLPSGKRSDFSPGHRMANECVAREKGCHLMIRERLARNGTPAGGSGKSGGKERNGGGRGGG
eukprot:1401330-Rhodomonas_salina.1